MLERKWTLEEEMGVCRGAERESTDENLGRGSPVSAWEEAVCGTRSLPVL